MTVGEAGSSFRVTIDRHDGRYRAGETLRGTVELSGVDDKVRGVDVKLRWRTVGMGNTDQDDVASLRLPVNGLGGRARVPFEVPLPLGPVSYRGPLVGVEWVLVVSVDVAWARDPERILPLTLLPADPQRLVSGGGIYRESGAAIYRVPSAPVRHQLGSKTVKAGAVKPRKFLGGFFALLGVGAVATQFHGVGFIMAPLGLIGAGAVAFVGIRRAMMSSALGTPVSSLVPPEARRGDVVRARMALRPRRRIRLGMITATLKGQETAVKGSGSSSTTHNHVLHAESFPFGGPEQIEGGKEVTLEVEVRIPGSAAPTFGSTSNDVTWTVSLELRAMTDNGSALAFDAEIVLHVQPS